MADELRKTHAERHYNQTFKRQRQRESPEISKR